MTTDSATAYTAHIRVGTHSWDIDSDDPAGYGPLAGLRCAWLAPQDEGWPTQHQPTELVFGIVVAAGDDFDDVDQGTTVHFTFTPAGYAAPLVNWGGTVRDLVGYPHDAGMVYQITAVDHLQALAEKYFTRAVVSQATTPPGTLWARLLQDANLNGSIGTTPALPDPWAGQASKPATNPPGGGSWAQDWTMEGSTWDVLRAVLNGSMERLDAATGAQYTPRYQRPVLTYKLDASGNLDAAQPFVGTWCPAGPRNAPLTLTAGPSGWIGDGGNVDAGVTATAPTQWVRERVEPNVVYLGSIKFERPHTGPDIIRRMPATDPAAPFKLDVINPYWVVSGVEGADQWTSALEVVASEDPSVVAGWFTLPDAMRTLVAVDGIDTRHTPSGTDRAIGMLAQAALLIPAGGRWSVVFKLRRTLPDPNDTAGVGGWTVPDALAWSELPPAMTWADFDPSLTWGNLYPIGD